MILTLSDLRIANALYAWAEGWITGEELARQVAEEVGE